MVAAVAGSALAGLVVLAVLLLVVLRDDDEGSEVPIAPVATSTATTTSDADRDAVVAERNAERAKNRRLRERLARERRRRRRETAPAPATPTPAATPAEPAYTACDANVSVAGASCTFADNVFYEHYVSGRASSISAYDPDSGGRRPVTCSSDGSMVRCSAGSTSVKFSVASVNAYTPEAAANYAASGNAGP